MYSTIYNQKQTIMTTKVRRTSLQVMRDKLQKMLDYIPEDKGISLEDDIFLVGELDGSDKIYGFIKVEDELLVVSRQVSDGYPVSDMDKGDLDYMFKLSSISKKIEKKKYGLVDSDEV